jgi:signal transduction histidine kinase
MIADKAPEHLADDLERLERHAGLLRDDLRSLSHGIYPPALVERGVAAALAEATLASSARVRITGTIPRAPSHVEYALYFSALEAVQNAVNHGGASARVQVDLGRTNGSAVLRVSDDGVGFDPDDPVDGAHHRGVASMRERTTAAGGTLGVRSEPGHGTSITITIPLAQEAA